MVFRCVTILTLCVLLAGSAFAEDLGWVAVENQSQAERLASMVKGAYARQHNRFLVEVTPKSQALIESFGLQFDLVLQSVSLDDLYLIIPPDKPQTSSTRLDRLGAVYEIGGGQKIMSLSPVAARALSEEGVFGAVKLSDAVVRISYKANASPGLSAAIQDFPTDSLAGLVSQDSLFAFDSRLEAFQTRYVLTDSIDAARDWAMQKFRDFGYTDVSAQEFQWSTTTQYNVMAIKPGYAEPDKVIVVGAHYDSITQEASPGRMLFAPGADDNGSGSSAVLELARVLANVPLRKTVIFMLFSAEEVGLIGSRAAAANFAADSVDIEVMYNYDMVANMTDGQYGIDIASGANPWYRRLTMDAAARVTILNTNNVGFTSGNSDHASFLSQGFDIVYSAESDFNWTGWHTNLDLSARLHFGYFTEVVRMGLASLAITANAAHPTRISHITDMGDGTSLQINWDECEPSYDYLLKYGPGPLNYADSIDVGRGVCSQIVTGLNEGQAYFFAVVGVPSDGGYPAIWAGEGSEQPLIEPRKPVDLSAEPGDRTIVLDWSDNPEADLDHYRIFRGTGGGTPVPYMNDVNQSRFVDSAVAGATVYTYRIAAVDKSGYESTISDTASSVAGTFDRGVLLVDEITRGAIEPIQAGQEAWFDELFSGIPYKLRTVDTYSEYLKRTETAPYSSLFWFDDDVANKLISQSNSALQWYAQYQANMFVEGYRTLSLWSPPTVPESHVLRQEFGVTSFTENAFDDFSGAVGEDGWPGVTAVGSKLFVRIPSVCVLEPDSLARVIYTYDSFTDDPAFEGKPCGLLKVTPEGNRIVLGFPLLYLDTASARALVQHALALFGEQIELVQSGDINGDSTSDISDVMAIVEYLYGDGMRPDPVGLADVDGSCQLDLADLAYYIDYLFNNGSAPKMGCARN